MAPKRSKPFVGARLAQEYAKEYRCEVCGGGAVVSKGGKQVRVRHRATCTRDMMIRLRWPKLRDGSQTQSLAA